MPSSSHAMTEVLALPSPRVCRRTPNGTTTRSDSRTMPHVISAFGFIDAGCPQTTGIALPGLSSCTTSLSMHAVSLYADQPNEAFPLRTSLAWTSPFSYWVVADSPGLSSDDWPSMNHGACSEFTHDYGLHLRFGSRTGFAGPFVTSLSTSLCSNAEKSNYRGERVLSPGEFVSPR